MENHAVRLGLEYLQADEVEPDDSPFWVKLGFKPLTDQKQDTLNYRKRAITPEYASG